MDTEPDIELLRLTAAIKVTEVQLAKERRKLRTADQQGKTTISIDKHVAAFLRRLDRLRALRINLLPDQKGGA